MANARQQPRFRQARLKAKLNGKGRQESGLSLTDKIHNHFHAGLQNSAGWRNHGGAGLLQASAQDDDIMAVHDYYRRVRRMRHRGAMITATSRMMTVPETAHDGQPNGQGCYYLLDRLAIC